MNYNDLIIIAIGTSFNSLDSLKELLSKLNKKSTNFTYVIQFESNNVDLEYIKGNLNKYVTLELLEIEHRETIKLNKIYISPNNEYVQIKNGKFYLDHMHLKNKSEYIDIMFSSLAIEKKDKAFSILLNGTGTDGIVGAKKIAELNGTSFIFEDTIEVCKERNIDLDNLNIVPILSNDFLVDCLLMSSIDKNYHKKYLLIINSMNDILTLLEKYTDIDFTQYKHFTVASILNKRMKERNIESIELYLNMLNENINEVEILKNSLLIAASSFFRNFDSFLKMEEYLYFYINNKSDNNLRVWIPACSTGEEVLSIGIIILDVLKTLNKNMKVTIFATDVNNTILSEAMDKSYTSEEMEFVPKKFMNMYFYKVEELYKPKKVLRDLIYYSKHDLIKDNPYLNIDFISCRNLLIYFGSEIQKKVISIFHYSLKQNGLLFLGNTESINMQDNLFITLEKEHKIFKKNSTIDLNDKTTLVDLKKSNELVHNIHFWDKNYDIEYIINDAISSKFIFEGVIVNEVGEILFFKTNCTEYINNPIGFNTNNINQLIVDYLKIQLRLIFNEAQKTKSTVSSKKIKNPNNNNYVIINIFPLKRNRLGDKTYFINFERKVVDDYSFLYYRKDLKEIDDLNASKEELEYVKEKLKFTIEDFEIKNQELQIINEELQSNIEELLTINNDLKHKYKNISNNYEEIKSKSNYLTKVNNELELSNNAYNTVLNDLNSHVLVLDEKLNIIKYNEGFLNFINLIKITDFHLSSLLLKIDLTIPNIIENIKYVISTGDTKIMDLEYKEKVYCFSISKLSNKLNKNDEFVVLSFIDKTDMVKNEKIMFEKSKFASLGEMIGNIAHQWRQPLNRLSTILMKLRIDFENNTLDEKGMIELQDKTDLIIQNMSKTIDDFKSFFSPNKLKRYFNVKNSVEDSILLTNDTLNSKNIIIETDLQDEIYLNSFENEFKQVVVNLINNAKDALHINEVEYGFILVTLIEKDEHIILSIKDNGGGISEKIIDRIFEPYFTTKFKFNGTGLGLYMSKLIIEDSLSGKLEISNNDTGVEAKIILNKE